MPVTSYRYPGEEVILWLTLLALLVILGLTAGATLCLVPAFVLIAVLLGYMANRSRHNLLLAQGGRISEQAVPGLDQLADQCCEMLRLPRDRVDFFVVRSKMRNAYTFGFSDPKVVVLYTSLFETMSADELKFVIGHELGHVSLRHVWLNTLLGGMSGIPTTLGGAIILTLAFRGWDRACEYSADRAGLLACGSLQAATSALVKLVAGQVHNQAEFQKAMAAINQEDDSPLNVLAEALSTHPLIVRRIAELKKYACSQEYLRLKTELSSL